jgi:hypothetical protein
MVVAQSLLVVPMIAALGRRLLLAGLEQGGEQLRSLGAGPGATALLQWRPARRRPAHSASAEGSSSVPGVG